jgi:hypothetical protein
MTHPLSRIDTLHNLTLQRLPESDELVND